MSQKRAYTIKKIQTVLIMGGFLWIGAWCLFGSFLGVLISQNQNILPTSWEFLLFKSAHAHMNIMGLSLPVIGLSLSFLEQSVSTRLIFLTSFLFIISTPCLGIGLIIQAQKASSIFGVLLSSFGAGLYTLSLFILSGLFIFGWLSKKHS